MMRTTSLPTASCLQQFSVTTPLLTSSTLSGWLGPYSANEKSMEESETGKRKGNAKEENPASTVAV